MLPMFGRLPHAPEFVTWIWFSMARDAQQYRPRRNVPVTGAERHEKDNRALIQVVAHLFGELAVITDGDADRPAICLDHLVFAAARDAPECALRRRGVYLFLPVQGPVSKRGIGHNTDRTRGYARGADDIDPVADGKDRHQSLEARGVVRQRINRLASVQQLRRQ